MGENEKIVTKRVSVITCALFLAYFLFTSGLIFEAMGSKTIERIDVPYSIALSGEKLGVLGIYNEDDLACAKWLAEATLPIYAGYNALPLVLSYFYYYPTSNGRNLANLRLLYIGEPTSEYYIFVTSWNTEHGKFIKGTCPGLRNYEPLPDLSGAVEVFRKGDAVVYYIGED